MKLNWRAIVLAGAFFAIAAAGQAAPICDVVEKEGEPVRFYLGTPEEGYELWSVPPRYLFSPVGPIAYEGEKRETVILRFWKETLEPFTWRDEKREQQTRPAGGDRQYHIVLLKARPTLELITRVRLEGSYVGGKDAPLDGTLLSNGMMTPNLSLPKVPYQELYWQRLNGKITDVIACSVEGSVPYPACRHNLAVGQQVAQFDYKRQHLEEWRSISREMTDFLQCFLRDD